MQIAELSQSLRIAEEKLSAAPSSNVITLEAKTMANGKEIGQENYEICSIRQG